MSDPLSNDLASLRIERDAPKPPRSGSITTILITIGVVGALAVGGYFAYPHLEAQIFKTEVKTTSISSISPAQASTQLTATGYVVARSHAQVSSKVGGRLFRVLVQEGQLVQAGAPVAELDDADQESAIAAARAKVLAAQARVAAERAALGEVNVQITRQRPLVEQGASARSALEDLEARASSLQAAVEAATAEVRAAQAEVDALRVVDDQLVITAPISGTVVTEPLEIGEVVLPQVPIFELADFSTLVVEVDVPEGRLSTIAVGSPTEIVLDAFPGRRFRGETLEIGRRVNRAKATIEVKVKFVDNFDGVLPDMSARVSFLTAQLSEEQLRAAERTIVPASAVVDRGGRKVVFVIDEGKVLAEPVELGAREDENYVLLQGPEPGTRVVDQPPQTLQSGQGVKERDSE